MTTGTLTAFPIPWNDSAAAFGLPLLAGANVWSGQNKFTGTIAAAATGTTSVEVSTSATGLPIIRMTYAAAATDQKLWEWYTTSSQMVLRTINDAGGSTSGVIAIDRSGVTPTNLTLTPPLTVIGTSASATTGTSSLQVGQLGADTPLVRWTCAAAAANSKVWEAYTTTTQWNLRMLDDAGAGAQNVMRFTRSGIAATGVFSVPMTFNGYAEVAGPLPALSLTVPKFVMGTAGTLPSTQYIYAAGGIDGKVWDCYAGSGLLSHRLTNDAGNSAQVWMQVNRSGMAVSSVAFPQGEVQATQAAITGPVKFGQYTLATLPSAAAFSGYTIDVTNATGGPKQCRSNGTNWIMTYNNTTVS